jgi:hypothetical protein
MAKKDKKAEKGDKVGKGKIPKTVAGVKVPKQIRKAGNEILDKANSPAGRELIATGIAALATAALAKSKAGKAAAHKVEETAKAGAQDAGQLADALGAAASAAMKHFFEKKA